jgi:RHS repeat-associated protein
VNTVTGAVAQRIEYDEFGVVLSDSNPGFQSLGFAGGQYDSDTGFVKFGAREYSPELGRWVSRDPSLFRGGFNLYGYADGDPVNKIDVDGKNPKLVAALLGFGVAGYELVTFFRNDPNASEKIRNKILSIIPPEVRKSLGLSDPAVPAQDFGLVVPPVTESIGSGGRGPASVQDENSCRSFPCN